MSVESPFNFLRPLGKTDKEILFGRDRDVVELNTKTINNRITVLYGATGVGKTSLVTCGLVNKKTNTKWINIDVRRNAESLTGIISDSQEQGSSISNEESESKILVLDDFHELFIQRSNQEVLEVADSLKSLVERK